MEESVAAGPSSNATPGFATARFEAKPGFKISQLLTPSRAQRSCTVVTEARQHRQQSREQPRRNVVSGFQEVYNTMLKAYHELGKKSNAW